MKTRSLIFGLGLLFISHSVAAPTTAVAGLGFEQRIGQKLPLDTILVDEHGIARPLRDYLGQTPVVLYFNYFRCPQLCSVVGDGVLDGLRRLDATIGRNLTVISLSIDPTDTPAAAALQQQQAVRRYGRTGAAAGWHTLTGNAAAIKAVTDAAGFHFTFDPHSRLFGHASGLVIVTPEGVVSRYFLGVDFPAPELAKAVERAASNKTGEPVFNLLLLCLQGGGVTGPYGRLIWTVLSISVGLTVLGVFGSIAWMLFRERRTRPEASP